MPEIAPREKVRPAPLSVLLVAAQPRADLEAIIADWLQFFIDEQQPGEILLLDDTDQLSDDPTWQEKWPQLRVIHHTEPLGFGGMLQTGFAMARYPLVLASWADRQFRPPDAHPLLEKIDEVDLVHGFRNYQKPPEWIVIARGIKSLVHRLLLGEFPQPREGWLGWNGWGRRWLARKIFGVPLTDPESGFFLARRAFFEKIPFQSASHFAYIELLAKANHLGCLFWEAPVGWNPAEKPSQAMNGFYRDGRQVFQNPDFGHHDLELAFRG